MLAEPARYRAGYWNINAPCVQKNCLCRQTSHSYIMQLDDDEHELTILRLLDQLVHGASARAVIDPIASRVEAQLSAEPTAPLAWEAVPLTT